MTTPLSSGCRQQPRTTRKPDPAHWLTVSDAARELGMAYETIAREIDAGRMPGQRIGRRRLIARAEWERFRAGIWQPKPAPVQPTDLTKRRSAA